jgi:hypothetical protein
MVLMASMESPEAIPIYPVAWLLRLTPSAPKIDGGAKLAPQPAQSPLPNSPESIVYCSCARAKSYGSDLDLYESFIVSILLAYPFLLVPFFAAKFSSPYLGACVGFPSLPNCPALKLTRIIRRHQWKRSIGSKDHTCT